MTFNEIRLLRAVGMPQERILELAKSYIGSLTTCVVGSNTENPQIPGSAKVLLGISVMADTAMNAAGQTYVTVQLNNEIIFNTVPLSTFNAALTGNSAGAYTECLRKLTGKDVLKLTFTCNVIAGNVDYTIVYLS